MNYEIIDSIWFTSLRETIGIVAIRIQNNKWKAYIGTAHGISQALDENYVAQNGAKVSAGIACAAFPSLDPKEFVY